MVIETVRKKKRVAYFSNLLNKISKKTDTRQVIQEEFKHFKKKISSEYESIN